MAERMQVRRDTAANWTSNNPVLNSGEWGFETDTELFKVGDGTTTWTSLGYKVTHPVPYNLTGHALELVRVSADELSLEYIDHCTYCTMSAGTENHSVHSSRYPFGISLDTTMTISKVMVWSRTASSVINVRVAGVLVFSLNKTISADTVTTLTPDVASVPANSVIEFTTTADTPNSDVLTATIYFE